MATLCDAPFSGLSAKAITTFQMVARMIAVYVDNTQHSRSFDYERSSDDESI